MLCDLKMRYRKLVSINTDLNTRRQIVSQKEIYNDYL